MEEPIRIRAAEVDEAPAVAHVWLRSRSASIPSIPAPVHSEEAVRAWFSGVVLPTLDVWVATSGDGHLVGLLVLDGHWVDQLYVDPDWFGRGSGSALLVLAKQLHPTGLDLWTFASNRGARRFYERHGFSAFDSTDHDNEEGAPAIHDRWAP
jgi:GNAT superfamily N-acetyltransferase